MVQNVEEFTAKLQPDSFGEVGILVDREIPIFRGQPAERVAAWIAEKGRNSNSVKTLV